MDKTKWSAIMLPKELVQKLEIFSDTNFSKSMGFTNKSQLAASAIRYFLEQYSESMAYLELIDVKDNQVTLLDHKLGYKVRVTIKNGKASCEKDKNKCKHIDFVWFMPRFQKVRKSKK